MSWVTRGTSDLFDFVNDFGSGVVSDALAMFPVSVHRNLTAASCSVPKHDLHEYTPLLSKVFFKAIKKKRKIYQLSMKSSGRHFIYFFLKSEKKKKVFRDSV